MNAPVPDANALAPVANAANAANARTLPLDVVLLVIQQLDPDHPDERVVLHQLARAAGAGVLRVPIQRRLLRRLCITAAHPWPALLRTFAGRPPRAGMCALAHVQEVLVSYAPGVQRVAQLSRALPNVQTARFRGPLPPLATLASLPALRRVVLGRCDPAAAARTRMGAPGAHSELARRVRLEELFVNAQDAGTQAQEKLLRVLGGTATPGTLRELRAQFGAADLLIVGAFLHRCTVLERLTLDVHSQGGRFINKPLPFLPTVRRLRLNMAGSNVEGLDGALLFLAHKYFCFPRLEEIEIVLTGAGPLAAHVVDDLRGPYSDPKAQALKTLGRLGSLERITLGFTSFAAHTRSVVTRKDAAALGILFGRAAINKVHLRAARTLDADTGEIRMMATIGHQELMERVSQEV